MSGVVLLLELTSNFLTYALLLVPNTFLSCVELQVSSNLSFPIYGFVFAFDFLL
jgi:hypothetical protein